MVSLILFLLMSVTTLTARIESSNQISTPTAVPLLTVSEPVTSTADSVSATATITEIAGTSDAETSTATGTIDPVTATLLGALIAASASIITVSLTSWFNLRQADIALQARIAENTLNLRLQAYSELAAAIRQLYTATAEFNSLTTRGEPFNTTARLEALAKVQKAADHYTDTWMKSRMYLTAQMDHLAYNCYYIVARRWITLLSPMEWITEFETLTMRDNCYDFMLKITDLMTEYVNSVSPNSVSKLPQVASEEGE